MPHQLKTNGDIVLVEPANKQAFTLEELQKLVGGFIEIVQTKGGTSMVINEEGKLKGLPINEMATQVYQHGDVDPIVGDVLVCNPRYIK